MLKNNHWSFFSLPQHQSLYEKSSSSLVVAADFHMKLPPIRIYPGDNRQFSCGYASGLIYFYGMRMKQKDYNLVPVICNPIKGRYAALQFRLQFIPFLERYRKEPSFFGFDPIDKQFKVLFKPYSFGRDYHKILTLGTGKMRWRNIKCSLPHETVSEGICICINGVLYYLGYMSEEMLDYMIVCFDVRSEKFKFIYPENLCDLINYKGKLGVIYSDDGVSDDAIELRVWVLEDAEKQEWSKYAYTLGDDKFRDVSVMFRDVSVVGVTASGEIVLTFNFIYEQPFYVFYYNPERNTLQRVEIQGFGEYHYRIGSTSLQTMLRILMLTKQSYSSQASMLHM